MHTEKDDIGSRGRLHQRIPSMPGRASLITTRQMGSGATHSQNSRELEVKVLLSDGLGLGHGLPVSVRRVGHPQADIILLPLQLS